jgi:dTDP-4-dehydrorhamnose reductase
MKILLTGCDGQVGREICRLATPHQVDLVATNRRTLDISDVNAVNRMVVQGIDLVVNAAAYTAVDKAETESAAADAVNALAPGLLAYRCRELDIPLIHLSTDYVFDGTSTRAYLETDPLSPLGVYGKSKAAGEIAVSRALNAHVILRTSWVFGIHGNNFVNTMWRLAAERDQLNIVADQIGRPTFAGSIAAAVLHIIGRVEKGDEPWGTYHFCDDGPTTWYGFADKAIQLAQGAGILSRRPAITPITTAQYPLPAPRPAYSVLNTRKFETTFPGFDMRSWIDGVRSMIGARKEAT